MKLVGLITCLIFSLTWVSCIQDEAPSAEADILACQVPGDILKREPIIENDVVTLMVKSNTDITRQAPEFVLTEGATIVPISGTVRDFSTPQYYTVTSEDGKWEKKYEVIYIIAGLSTTYSFEHALIKNNYDVFYEVDSEGSTIMTWASGNAGFSLTGAASKPSDFPTLVADNGKAGKCAELVTRSTGDFGAQLKMPIAAGNLFMGTFDVLSAVTNALKATKLGLPFEHVPTYLTGYYKYKAGEVFSENGKPVSGKKDKCDIYAIFYETDDNVKTLDGTNAFTSSNLISVARIKDQKETNEWTQFYIPFISMPGKVVDQTKLEAGQYNVAIVFSSSIDGNLFNGAVGSTLYIDEVELIHTSE